VYKILYTTKNVYGTRRKVYRTVQVGIIRVCLFDLTSFTAQIWLFGRDCQAGNLAQVVEDSQRHTRIQNNKKCTPIIPIFVEIGNKKHTSIKLCSQLARLFSNSYVSAFIPKSLYHFPGSVSDFHSNCTDY
jgi:hypothetical protein